MDELLAKAGSQAVTFAIRSGISLASTYAIKNVAKFLTKVPPEDRSRLNRTKQKLQTRIEIISSAIDLIKLVAARGNTNLESTLKLTKALKEEIDEFDTRVSDITENFSDKDSAKEVKEVECYMVDLLDRIEEAIPLINLSLTTSGANLNGSLPNQISPGRLLQAADIVNRSNQQFSDLQPEKHVQVGPSFQVTFYSIFYHRGRMLNNRLNEISWKETYPRAIVSIIRVPHEHNPYSYKLKVQESHDDGRYHDEDEETRELDVSLITRLFFSASGKLLKLEDRSTPVLVLKVNKSFAEPDQDEDDGTVEWLAFGEYEELYMDSSDSETDEEEVPAMIAPNTSEHKSLSLLEYVLRLCVLQSNDHLSILETDDERLALYLQDENKDNSIQMTESFDSQSSTPIKHKKKNDLTSRLNKMSIDDSPSTPKKQAAQAADDSPVPGEVGTMTPWEKDKLLKMVEQTPSNLRRSVLKKSTI